MKAICVYSDILYINDTKCRGDDLELGQEYTVSEIVKHETWGNLYYIEEIEGHRLSKRFTLLIEGLNEVVDHKKELIE